MHLKCVAAPFRKTEHREETGFVFVGFVYACEPMQKAVASSGIPDVSFELQGRSLSPWKKWHALRVMDLCTHLTGLL